MKKIPKDNKKIVEKDGIFEFEEIIKLQEAFFMITNYADNIFDYLNTNKEKIFADKVRLANFGNKAYELFREFDSDRDAMTVHIILGLNPEDVLQKNIAEKKKETGEKNHE